MSLATKAVQAGQISVPLNYMSLVATVTLALVGLIVWWVRGIPDRRRAADEGDGSLRKDLLARITELEDLRIKDRKQCQEEQELLRSEIRSLQERVTGLLNDFLQYQRSVARLHPALGVIPLGEHEEVMGIAAKPLLDLYHIEEDSEREKQ